MKKFLALFFICLVIDGISQSPQRINYQGVARNSSGNIVTTPIGIKFQIYQGSVGGTLVYEETNTATPSSAGVFTVQIGGGVTTSGTFSVIAWGSGPYFLQVNIDPAGGTSYSTVGASQLVSVPFALFAEKAGNVVNYNAGNGISISSGSITNTAPDQTVNISALGIATVTNAYPNFSVNVGPPSLTYNTGTKELILNQGGTSTSATLTGTGGSTISMIGTGIASVTPAGAGSNFTVNVNPPVILGQGATTVMGSWPNFTVSSTAGTSYVAGSGISISGNTITNTAPNQTVSVVGLGSATVSGTYPNFTIATPVPTVIPPPSITGAGISTVTNVGNSFTVTTPPVNMNYMPGTGILSYSQAIGPNTVSINPALTFTNGTLGVGANTITIPGVGLWSRPSATATILNNTNDFVGIGTNSPSERLQVQSGANSDISIVATGSNRATLNLGSNINHFISAISYHAGTNNMDITSNGIANRMFFEFTGRTGIGTNAPVSELDVNGSLRLGGSRLFFGPMGGVNSGYTGIYENASDLKFAVFQSTAPANLPFATGNSIDAMVIKSNTGNVGIGVSAPTNKFAVGNSNIEKLNISGANGGINLLDDQGSITFPASTAAAKPMIQMFASGTGNPTRMVLAHSPAFPTYGLQYDDVNDRFNFIGNSNPVLTTDLTTLRVGVGTFTPQALLEVAGEERISGAAGKIYFKDQISANPFYYTAYVNNGAFHIQYGAAASNFYLNGANCYVGTGFMGGGPRLTVGTSGDGSNAVANAWSVFSDRRFKENIESLKDPISIVNNLQGVTYTWRKTGRKDIGFIAQDVESVLPDIVFTDEESGYKSVDYARITPVLIEAVKEQQKMIQDLIKKQAELEKEINLLKNK